MTDTQLPKNDEELDKIISDAFHQIHTRALRDAPIYLSHISIAKDTLRIALRARDTKILEQAEEEILDFAIEVIQQYAYEPKPGTFTSGGLSTLETAFTILSRNGQLNKKGHFVTKTLASNTTKEKL